MNKNSIATHQYPVFSRSNSRVDSFKKPIVIKLFLSFFLALCICLAPGIVKGQLTASFTADDTAGCVGMIVNFTSTSTGASSYSWDLGTGSATGPTASGSYTAPGTYTVTLTAMNGTSSSTASTIIHVYALPTVVFSAADTAVCPGTPVTFSNTSTSGAWGPMRYNWNFGDGYSSTASAPSHAYGAPGHYNITLIDTSIEGCVSSATYASYVHIYTPASIGFTPSGTFFCKHPVSVSFTNTTTGTAPLTYAWTFGDGGTSPSASPTHTYSVGGTYGVRLKVTDGKGCVDSSASPASITVNSLSVSFYSVSSACSGVAVAFYNTSSTHISSNWNFGDGYSSTTELGVHTYSAAGTYTVRLIVYDGTCYDTVTHPISIIASPAGGFTISPLTPCPPPVTLNFTGSVPSGSSVSWLFGDGSSGSGATTSHSYSTSEVLPISMIITNSSGCVDTVVKMDTLYNLYLNPSASPTSGCSPLPVDFTAYAYSVVWDPLSGSSLFVSYPYSTTTYTWNFGDGSPTSSSATPSHTYTAAGTFTATCTINTANACVSSNTVEIKVGTQQTASFTATPTHMCAGRSIYAHSTSTSSSLIDMYDWGFGDGYDTSAPALINPVHEYTLPGTHTVSLIVEYNGCLSTPFTIIDVVDSPSSIINYTYTCIPDNGISFIDNSLGDNTHEWFFGDGYTSTASAPVHYYPALSSYTVSLTTYNSASGCRDTSTAVINLAKPAISLAATDSTICRDLADTIYNNVTGRSAIGYRWYVDGVLTDTVDASLVNTYHTTGLHSITLIIKDNFDCLDTFTKSNYILVAKPVDNFTFSPPSGCAPLAVHFSDMSTDVAGASIVQYAWSFGDGATSTSSASFIFHTYGSNGVYNVEEIVTDNIGCSDTLISPSHPTINKPTASFYIASTTLCAGTSVYFLNSSVGISGALWIFGDGTSSTAISPYHTYSTPGVYNLKLVVFDTPGCASDTLNLPAYITVNPSPTASFTMSDSFAVCPPLNVSYTNTSTGVITSYKWLFGDGDSSSAFSPSDDFVAPGYYTSKLITSNSYGCTDTAFSHVNLFGYAGGFTYTPVSGCAPLDVNFSTTLGGGVSSISWDFNDGTIATSTTGAISHTYLLPGRYLPKLILSGGPGCTSFSVGIDSIKADTIIPAFTILPNPVCRGASIAFHDSSFSYSSSISNWLWTFGPGATSSLSAPAHTYTASGVQPVTLSVKDSLGCIGAITQNVTVNPFPSAITGSTNVCQGGTIALGDSLSGGVWSSIVPATATIGSTTGVVTGLSPGGVTISYSLGSGCTATKSITVNPLPGSITGLSSVCIGSSIHLTDSVAGGTWSVSATSGSYASVVATSGTVTGIATGTAIVSYVLPTGCASTFTVNVSPTPTIITGASGVCVGSSTTLLNGTPGGLWTSSNTSVAIVGSGSGTVSGVTSGPVTITYSTGGALCSVYKTMTVNPIPATITGALNLCVGATVHLADSTSGGTWGDPASTGIASITAGAGILTGLHSGVALISYTAAGCLITTNVTVNATPSIIGGSSILCSNASIGLTDSVSGGAWSSPSTLISIGSGSGLVSGISGAAYGAAIVTYAIGGCVASKTLTVNPIPPIIGPSGLCALTSITLVDSGGGYWTSSAPSVATIGSSTGIVNGITHGTSTITYTMATGCKAMQSVTVNGAPTTISGTKQVCVLATTMLSDSSGGGTWSIAPASTAIIGSLTGMVTGVSHGVAAVTYSLGSGCTITGAVTVNPIPSAVTGSTHACVGLTAAVADTTAGGIWASSNAHATVTTGGIVTGITAGTATISYSVAGCAATTTFTVNPLPPAISGPANVCVGLPSSFADTAAAGTWSSGNTSIATTGTPAGSVTGVAPGTVNIIYTLPTGCAISKTVTVNLAPHPITGAGHLCIGTTAPLSDSTPGGLWSSSDDTFATVGAATGIVTALATGVTTIAYSLGGACTSTYPVTINSFPAAFSVPATICAGSPIPLSDLPSGGAWSSSNPGIISVGASTGIITGASTGAATITYSLGPGCTAHSTPITVNPLPPAIVGPDVLCVGYSASVHDPGTGGVWSSSISSVATITTSGLVSAGSSGGVTVISYTIASGCAATLALDVIKVPAIAGIAPICGYGSTLHLTDSMPGGAWTASLVTVTDSGIVTSYAAGLATIYYTLSSGCFTSATLTVNPLPDPISGISRLCTGLSTTFSDLTTGGVWSSGVPAVAGAGSSTGNITGISPGMSMISYTMPLTGCMQSIPVTVSSFPSPIGGTALVCAGSSVTLTDTTGGGVWTSATTGIVVVGSSTGVAAGISAGTSLITYTVAPSCAVTGTITVNPLPGSYSVTGGGNYCMGDTGVPILLSGSATGTGYQLYEGTTAIGGAIAGTGSSLDFGPETGAGVYKVIATNTATSCNNTMADSATVAITPDVTPSFGLSSTLGDTICMGFATTFSVLSIVNGGTSPAYQWTVNGLNSGADSAAYTYVPSNGDTVKVILTSDAVCARPDTASRKIIMTVDPLLIPVVNIVTHPGLTIFTGQNDSFTAVITGGGTDLTYQWEKDGSFILGATSQTYVDNNPSSGDSITCVVTSGGICGGLIGFQSVKITVINNVGVTMPIASSGLVTVVPNPNKGEFMIQGTLASKLDEDVSLEITDMVGQVIYKSKILAKNGIINEHIAISPANGTYILLLRSGTENEAFHIVIEQ